MKLTKFAKKDYAGLKDFMTPIWRETYAEILPKAQVEYLIEKYFSLEAIAEYCKKGYRYFYVTDGEVCGVVVIWEKEREVHLDKLYLLPEARGKGYADFVFGELKKIGKDITLNVSRENVRAVKCYRKNGFLVESELEIPLEKGMVNFDYRMRWVCPNPKDAAK